MVAAFGFWVLGYWLFLRDGGRTRTDGWGSSSWLGVLAHLLLCFSCSRLRSLCIVLAHLY